MRIRDVEGAGAGRIGLRLCACVAAAGLFVVALPAVALSSMEGGASHAWRASQGYLGVNFRDIADDQVSALRLKDAHGAEIFVLDHDGPGCKSGLREHDVILRMNGQEIEGEEELRRRLRETPPGRTVNFVISRDGQLQTISTQLADRAKIGQEAWERHMTVPDPSLTPETRTPASGWHGNGFLSGGSSTSVDAPKHGFLGTTILSSSYTGALLEMMGPQLEDYFGAPGGLLVRAVDPSSPASQAGMRAGDVVIKINAAAVTTGNDWLKTVHENRGRSIPVVVLRDRKEQVLTLTPDSKKRSSVIPKLWLGSKSREDQVGTLHLPAEMP